MSSRMGEGPTSSIWSGMGGMGGVRPSMNMGSMGMARKGGMGCMGMGKGMNNAMGGMCGEQMGKGMSGMEEKMADGNMAGMGMAGMNMMMSKGKAMGKGKQMDANGCAGWNCSRNAVT